MATVTILDDYQRVALSSADWAAVQAIHTIEVVDRHVSDHGELAALLRASEIVVVMRERTPFPESLLRALPKLRLLITTGMANASIDLAAARAVGVTVCGTGGSGNAMPELTIGMIIALTRNFAQEDAAIRAGGWQHTIGAGLQGSTLGVLGLGRLGTPVATLARALGMSVIAWSPHLTPERAATADARAVDKRTLFEESDIVTIHVPLVDATRGIVGAPELAAMKRTAYLVNTSRGPIVDEPALITALQQQRIAGAGLDVYDGEPLRLDHPFRGLRNTLLLPHIGYVTSDNYRTMYGHVVDDILAWQAEDPIRILTGPTANH